MGGLTLRMVVFLACIFCSACEPKVSPRTTDISKMLNVAADARVEPAAPATLEQKVRALGDFGVMVNTSQLGEPIRLDMARPFHSPGNNVFLHATTGSTHTSGGFVTLLPPYDMTLLGNTYERVPTVVLRVDPKNFVRLVDCQGNGPPDLNFALKETASVHADPISLSVVTRASGHWYFVIPPSNETGFANSEYVHITLNVPDGPLQSPIDVRLVGCDITPVN